MARQSKKNGTTNPSNVAANQAHQRASANSSAAPPILRITVALANDASKCAETTVSDYHTTNDLAYKIAESAFCVADELLAKMKIELPSLSEIKEEIYFYCSSCGSERDSHQQEYDLDCRCGGSFKKMTEIEAQAIYDKEFPF